MLISRLSWRGVKMWPITMCPSSKGCCTVSLEVHPQGGREAPALRGDAVAQTPNHKASMRSCKCVVCSTEHAVYCQTPTYQYSLHSSVSVFFTLCFISELLRDAHSRSLVSTHFNLILDFCFGRFLSIGEVVMELVQTSPELDMVVQSILTTGFQSMKTATLTLDVLLRKSVLLHHLQFQHTTPLILNTINKADVLVLIPTLSTLQ